MAGRCSRSLSTLNAKAMTHLERREVPDSLHLSQKSVADLGGAPVQVKKLLAEFELRFQSERP